MSDVKSKAIAGKVAKVMTEVRRLKKDGRNEFDKYNFISGDQAFAVVGGAMAEAGLVALPSIVEITTDTVPTKNGSQYRTVLHGQITLADADTGDTWTSDWYGEGTDRGDKSINKAMTAMMKYYLLRLFQIGSGEDADADSPEEPKPAERQAPPPQAQHRAARPPAQRPNPVPEDVPFMPDNPFDDVPNHKANDEAAASSAHLLYSGDTPMTDLAGRLIAKCHELDKTSGGKKLSTQNKDGQGAGQYGLLAGKIDHIIGTKQHGAVLSALVGVPVSKENPPGWKLKELIDWLNDDAKRANTEAAIKDVWAALQSMEVEA